MKIKKAQTPAQRTAQQPAMSALDYYSLSPSGKFLVVTKAILKIIYQKIRHPYLTYQLRKAEIEKNKKEPSIRSKLAVLLFCIFTGFLGGHRFYARRYFSAILYFFTIGFLFIGVIFDLVLILKNKFKDGHGRSIIKWRVKGDVLALLIAFFSIVIMSLELPRALATVTFYSCKAGEYVNLIEKGYCNEYMIFDAFTSRNSGQLTNELAPIVRSDKKKETEK